MSYKLIKGQFYIFYPDMPRNGPEPDGDTLKFKPDNPVHVGQLHSPNGGQADFNGKGMVNLRFEGIDALETHFQQTHQNMPWAEAARDALLQAAGFGRVTYWDDLPQKVQTVEHNPVPGYILARGLDIYGRIIAFVFPGHIDKVDGVHLFLDTALLDQSINAMLVQKGLVFPAFYTTLPADLRKRLAQLTHRAKEDRMGLWPDTVATVNHPATITGLAELEKMVIWPKLFRRLSSYFGAGFNSLGGFDTWLRADPVNRDDSVLLPNLEIGHMHDLIAIQGDTLRMLYKPEDIVILPDGTVPADIHPPIVKRSARVRIMAALVNPIGPEDKEETVTLFNTGPDPIDFSSGWTIVDYANKREVLSGTLAAGEAMRIVLRKVRLNNNGDTITLLDDQARQVDQVNYSGREVPDEGWSITF